MKNTVHSRPSALPPKKSNWLNASRAVALLLLLAGLAGCASMSSREDNLPTPVAPDAQTAARYQQGRSMYARKCGRCHELFDPAEYSADDWPGYVKRYGPRAGLIAEDRATVIEYLQASAQRLR